MDTRTLRALHKVASLRLSELREREPALFAALRDATTTRAKAFLRANRGLLSPRLGEVLQGFEVDPLVGSGATPGEAFLRLLHQRDVPSELRQEAEGLMAQLERVGLLGDREALERPLAENPLLENDRRRMVAASIAEIAELDEARSDALLNALGSDAGLTPAVFQKLAEERVLDRGEVERFAASADAVTLADGHVRLAAELQRAARRNDRPAMPSDIARLSAEDWKASLERSEAPVPQGIQPDAYAARLRRRAEAFFPTVAFQARLPPRDAASVSGHLVTLAPLMARDPNALRVRFEELGPALPDGEEPEALRASHAQMQRLVRLTPGLDLDGIIESDATPENKAEQIAVRLGLLEIIEALNPEVEFVGIDYSKGSEDLARLNTGELRQDEIRMALSVQKARQRMFGLTRDAGTATEVMAAGFHSARAIAQLPASRFGSIAGLSEEVAYEIHHSAKLVAMGVAGTIGTMMELLPGVGGPVGAPQPMHTMGGTAPEPETLEYLKSIDGYDELFGNQDYCRCKECQSILSAAAYFVDLMHFVDVNIRQVVFIGSKASHPLDLFQRRSDLWTLPLTCENTDQLIPYLQIVNEILETYIAKQHGLAGDPAVAVYEQVLATAEQSIRQPFVLPLERLRIYLGVLDASRAEIARALGAPDTTVTDAVLGLTAQDRQLITTPSGAEAFLETIFGLDLTIGAGGKADPFQSKLLTRGAGISRDALGDLAASDFVTAGGTEIFLIKAEKATADSVQNDVERIHDLTLAHLDRMHRMLRLQRNLPWSIAELDLVLKHLAVAGLGSGLDATALGSLARILALAQRMQTGAEGAVPLFDVVPDEPLQDGEPGLLERVFTPKLLADPAAPLPDPAIRLVHPSFRAAGSPGPTDNRLHRLRAGVQLSDEELAVLIRALAAPFGLDFTTANEADRGMHLSLGNLTLLYRHALVARHLGLTIGQLFQLITLGKIGTGHLAGIGDIEALIGLHDWWRGSGFTLDELGYVTRGPVADASTFVVPDALAAAMIEEIGAERKLEFADTLLAYLPGVTDLQSRAVIAANAARFERLNNGALRLVANFQPALALTLPAGVTVAEPAIRAALMEFHADRVLARKIAARLAIAPGAVGTLLAMAGIDLLDASYAAALHAGTVPPLAAALDKLARLAMLFRHPAYDGDALQFVLAGKALFGVTDFNAVTVPEVRELTAFVALADATADALFATKRPPADPAAVRQAMTGFAVATGFAAVPLATMAAALRHDPALVNTLLGRVALPGSAGAALLRLARAAELAVRIGVDGVALQRSTASAYADMALAADAVLGAIRTRYSDPAEFANRTGPGESKLLSLKRDGLTESILRDNAALFEGRHDLYAYFLIDVEMEGCAETSRIVAAASSLQLYVNRVLMNLEEDRTPPADPDHVRVSLPADAILEWRWRKNFRVWQANRKVFLFTHHFIEPDLLDKKTPLFQELESTLLQKDINDDTALEAYAAYLSGFDEIARLAIAGSYHDMDPASGRDVLHLLGVTPADPPIYYYRTIDNVTYGETRADRAVNFSPWKKLDVQVSSRVASPVVHLGRLFVFWNDLVTKPESVVENATSTFVGYKHKMLLRYTTLKLDGSWSTPQGLALTDPVVFQAGDGVILDLLEDGKPRYDQSVVHTEPVEGYAPRGFLWDRIYPDRTPSGLFLMARAFAAMGYLDFYRKALGGFGAGPAKNFAPEYFLCSRDDSGLRTLYYGSQWKAKLSAYAQATVIADDRRLEKFKHTDGLFLHMLCLESGLYQKAMARMSATAEIHVINGTVTDAVIDSDGDHILLQRSARPGPNYLAKRLGTTLVESMVKALFTGGVDNLLATSFQTALKEAPNPLAIISNIEDRIKTDGIDFRGSLGDYYTEIFFLIPFLIANHLNGRQKFAEAQHWYQYIFDPTANELTTPPTDRVWRFSRFRGLGLPKLKDILTDKAAIDVYRHDPFNPHAIARLRLSAYQKCIVLKYVKNLLDWADSLFTLFTTESVGEATMLYVMAYETMGLRSAPIGDCEEPDPPRTYESLKPLLDKGTDFAVQLENIMLSGTGSLKGLAGPGMPKPGDLAAGTAAGFDLLVGKAVAGAKSAVSSPTTWKKKQYAGWKVNPKNGAGGFGPLAEHTLDEIVVPGFTMGILNQYAALFCIPEDKELQGYWDRIEDRLFKIHNCMDITGARRELSLFAPEIDPRLLVRARAEGLSLEDVLASSSGSLPPYRFTYLIERAKQYAAALQGFGSQLLSALEKKDAEELNRLRTVHQQKILTMSTRIRQWEIDAANDAIQQLERQKEVVQFRFDFFKAVADLGLTASENEHQTARDRASDLQMGAAALDTLASVAHLLPQLGSPFSLKWGGLELGKSSDKWSEVARIAAGGFDAKAVKASVEATFQRRDEGWRHQQFLAQKELPPVDKALSAAKFRKQMAERSLAVQEEMVAQIEEMWRFHNERFSNLGLFTYLSTTLQRLFREAYVTALGMARLVEQAYRYERADEATPLLSTNHWDASKAGLLAGERLLLDLQNLEKQFIETNYRKHEVDQPFSLAQIDPAALVTLRETGACTFEIPELFFDLAYPGHYARHIRSVRLTIPCVTGPFTNVGATLTLTGSFLRNEPKLGAASLKAVPLRHTTSIATSTAQNDPGVLEFSFRDERYMPFEGAGAVSKWNLKLPRTFRAFDYQTINDVIVHIAYTAEHDALFGETVEEVTGTVEGALLKVLRTEPLARTFSLRQDFSSAFNRIVHSAAGTAVKIEIGERQLATIFRGRPVDLVSAKLALRTGGGQPPGAAGMSLNGTSLTGFADDPALGGLRSVNAGAALAAGLTGEHTIVVQNAGSLAPNPPRPGDPSAFDEEKLLDILLHVEYRLRP